MCIKQILGDNMSSRRIKLFDMSVCYNYINLGFKKYRKFGTNFQYHI